MIYDKRRSLDRALLYSYQGANVRKMTGSSFGEPARALINSNKLKQDYDDKTISIGFEVGFKPGDVFEWMNTQTLWLIYLQELTELAYFRADIRKCSHILTFEDEEGVHKIPAAVRGPVETRINSIQKHRIIVDNPNYSLNILVSKNDITSKFFKRYNKFYLRNDAEKIDSSICWRVEAVNDISMPGIIEIAATEYYSNEMEDKNVLEDVDVGVIESEPAEPIQAIAGPDEIKPKQEYKYIANSIVEKEWSVLNGVPVKVRVDTDNPYICYITWISGFSGRFDLSFGNVKKSITVRSLF